MAEEENGGQTQNGGQNDEQSQNNNAQDNSNQNPGGQGQEDKGQQGSGGGRGEKLICPYCGGRLTPEMTATKVGGPMHKAAWDGIYNLVFMTRRTRYLCLNPKCQWGYYPKTRVRFVKGLAYISKNSIFEEHLLNDAIRRSHRQHKSLFQRVRDALGLNANTGEGGQSRYGGQNGNDGTYHGGNPLAGKGPKSGKMPEPGDFKFIPHGQGQDGQADQEQGHRGMPEPGDFKFVPYGQGQGGQDQGDDQTQESHKMPEPGDFKFVPHGQGDDGQGDDGQGNGGQKTNRAKKVDRS